MSNDMIAVNDPSIESLEKMAKYMAASGMFGLKKFEDVVALMIIARAQGRAPGLVAMEYHVINGRPSLSADAMLARFQEAGGYVEWHELTSVIADATFTPPKGGPLRLSWTMGDAKIAGLGDSATWKKYPRAMLRSRVISEGVRSVWPSIVLGTYTPDEIESIELPVKVTGNVQEPSSCQDAPPPQPLPPPPPPMAISDAQHKRLEAMLTQFGADREKIKIYCKHRWGVEHFTELDRSQYELLCRSLEFTARKRIIDEIDALAGDRPIPPLPHDYKALEAMRDGLKGETT